MSCYLAGTGLMFNAVPRGFIPTQDKLYLIAGVKLPEGSSLERTDAVLQRMKDLALDTDGVAHVIGLTVSTPHSRPIRRIMPLPFRS